MDVAARSIEAMKKIAQLRQQVEEESDEEEEVRRERGRERKKRGENTLCSRLLKCSILQWRQERIRTGS